MKKLQFQLFFRKMKEKLYKHEWDLVGKIMTNV